MSEEIKHRPPEEIKNQYGNVCARAGQVQYQLVALKKDLDLINEELHKLSFEFAASSRAAQEATAPAPEAASNVQS